MAAGIPYDSREGRAICRRHLRADDRRLLCHQRRNGGRTGPLPRIPANNRDAMLRVVRNHRRAAHGESTGYEKAGDRAGAARLAAMHATRIWPRRQARLGRRAGARRGVRLPQRPGHRDRAHRHHRPGDGLRHHRRRARLRAGEVQEAGGRRLFQDHQPLRARSAAPRLGYTEAEIDDIVAYAVGHGTLERLHRQLNHDALRAKGFGDEEIGKIEGRWTGLRHPLRLQQMDAWARSSAATSSSSIRPRLDAPDFDMLKALGFSKRRYRRRQPPCLRRHDPGRRAASEGRASAGVRLRQSVRRIGKRSLSGGEPYPHDGGGAALHLRRHLQDHQHAERRHGRRNAAKPICCPGSWG